ncbi:HNH endonuclease [Brucella intermedia]|uniref:HNH endonuclease n=1 Tax=Brucella intermedia TaxID=94625 RepID=UPI00209BB840|nr:HNH endonuclease [Brucella intermedia]MCO7736425.1 HNH endonuclease [Brucella intermedia]WLF99098.1 HNH endonuclease [Brucella intermedia]
MEDCTNNNVTIQRLKEILNYEPETGFFKWRVNRGGKAVQGSLAGTRDRQGYIRINLGGRIYAAHRLAWFYMNGTWPKDQIDHRDLDKANNSWANLREATHAQNQANTSSKNITGFKGVEKHGSRYRAYIRSNGKKQVIGTFSTPQEAHVAYVQAANDNFGEFARAS